MNLLTTQLIGGDLPVVEGNTPIIIPNKGGYKTTPSVVAVSESGKRLVGHIAKRQALTNPTHTVSAAKRLLDT